MARKVDAKLGERIVVQVDADLKKLMPRFLDGRRKDIESILTALEQGDYQSIQVLGHSLRGSGGSYGIDAISEMGQALEQAAQARDSQQIREHLNELVHFLDRVEIVYR
jgi:HPt (histidine-containing phosphotransfer) domain-containing protein